MIALILALGQDCTTDASVARAALRLAEHGLPAPEEIRVYDFINFFKHDLPENYAEGPVAFDARLLRKRLPNGQCGALLQLGFRTARVSREDLRPMNLAIVIDRSGSMGDAKKLDYVKQALEVFISNLRECDRLALVIYDDKAEVLLSSTAVSDPRAILALVRQIQPGGSTNLHGGLMLGYAEVEKHLDAKRTNKVILMSDGLANAGITEPEKIVADSKKFNDLGIDLTTIGIGLDYNDKVMNQLAKAGRGDYHFLNDAKEIDRIFKQELDGLFEKVARSPKVRVTLGKGVSLRAVYGYAFRIESGALVFDLDDMGNALTQILPIELAVAADADVAQLAEATLEYEGAKPVIRKVAAERSDADEPADAAVLKHLTIARLAQALQDGCRLARDHSLDSACDLLCAALRRVDTLYGKLVDGDPLKRVYDLANQAVQQVRATAPD